MKPLNNYILERLNPRNLGEIKPPKPIYIYRIEIDKTHLDIDRDKFTPMSTEAVMRGEFGEGDVCYNLTYDEISQVINTYKSEVKIKFKLDDIKNPYTTIYGWSEGGVWNSSVSMGIINVYDTHCYSNIEDDRAIYIGTKKQLLNADIVSKLEYLVDSGYSRKEIKEAQKRLREILKKLETYV